MPSVVRIVRAVELRRVAGALLTIVIVGGASVSAHRTDEYLQAARLAIEPGRVQIELDLTPGIALAEAIVVDIDRNRDGLISADEQRSYAAIVLGALELEIDGTPLRVRRGESSFPEAASMKRGEGTIRLQSSAALAPLSMGSHHLLFRNNHHPDRSVYLANAMVPESDQVAVTAQRRDGNQSQLIIDFQIRAAPATSTTVWLLGIAAAALASAVLMRASRLRG